MWSSLWLNSSIADNHPDWQGRFPNKHHHPASFSNCKHRSFNTVHSFKVTQTFLQESLRAEVLPYVIPHKMMVIIIWFVLRVGTHSRDQSAAAASSDRKPLLKYCMTTSYFCLIKGLLRWWNGNCLDGMHQRTVLRATCNSHYGWEVRQSVVGC